MQTINKIDDVFSQVLAYIETNELDRAKRLILSLPDPSEQIELLSQLSNSILRDLDSGRTFALARGLDLGRAFALARDLDHELSRGRASAPTRETALALALTLALARGLGLDLDLDQLFRMVKVIISVLDRMATVTNANEQSLVFPVSRIVLDGVDRLTPQVLIEQIGPFFQAISELQGIIIRLQGKEFVAPRIISITQNSPIGAELEGAAQAINIIDETITPWRREHSRRLAEIELRERELKLEALEAEIASKRAQADQARMDAKGKQADNEQKLVTTERMRIENQRLQLQLQKEWDELHESRIELAEKIIRRWKPDISSNELIAQVMRLMKILPTLTDGTLQIIEATIK